MGYSRSSMPVALDARPRDLEGIVQANPEKSFLLLFSSLFFRK